MSCVSCLGNWSWMKILKAVAGVRWVAHHNLKSSWWIRDISFWEEVNWRDKETDTSWDVSGSPRHPLLRVCSLQWQRVFHHPHCGWSQIQDFKKPPGASSGRLQLRPSASSLPQCRLIRLLLTNGNRVTCLHQLITVVIFLLFEFPLLALCRVWEVI